MRRAGLIGVAALAIGGGLVLLSGCGVGAGDSSAPSGALLYQWLSPGKDTVYVQETVDAAPVALQGNTGGINEYHPDWSPSGSQIAFVAEYVGRKEIWLADGDGSNLRQLYAGPADMPWAEHPAWSPDGRSIVFEITDAEPTYAVSTRSELIEIDVESGQTQEVASLDANEGILSEPRWSPDGTAIVCTIGRFDATGTTFTGQALAVLHSEAGAWGEPELITDFTEFTGYPDWGGPDGRIVYATGDRSGFFFIVDNHSDEMTSDAPTAQDIYTITEDGSDRRDVTTGTDVAGRVGQPSWAPDGRIVLTVWPTADGETPTFAMINQDSTGLQQFDVPSTHTRISPSG